jgi:hypothetical protein
MPDIRKVIRYGRWRHPHTNQVFLKTRQQITLSHLVFQSHKKSEEKLLLLRIALSAVVELL